MKNPTLLTIGMVFAAIAIVFTGTIVGLIGVFGALVVLTIETYRSVKASKKVSA